MKPPIKLHLACGTDYREGYINIDIDKNVKADVYQDFTKGLPFKNNSVDEIFSKNVFEHIPNPLDFLLEIKRVLKKGGTAKLITSNASYFIYHFPRKVGYHDSYNIYHDENDQHYFMFQKGHLEAFSKRAGFKIKQLDYFIGDFRKSRNRKFQEVIAKIIGKKFGYSDFLWVIEK
ncbi:MAG: methyltransferase domain-containing protein [Candidatus Pacearchaeota archaeon]|jgi:predicted SAM-dependent methyltransferase